MIKLNNMVVKIGCLLILVILFSGFTPTSYSLRVDNSENYESSLFIGVVFSLAVRNISEKDGDIVTRIDFVWEDGRIKKAIILGWDGSRD